jgi:hypothetical protein
MVWDWARRSIDTEKSRSISRPDPDKQSQSRSTSPCLTALLDAINQTCPQIPQNRPTSAQKSTQQSAFIYGSGLLIGGITCHTL